MKVVIAVDGSHVAHRAVRAFLQLAMELAVPPEIRLIAVVDYADLPETLAKTPPDAPDLLAEQAGTALAMAQELCAHLGTHAQGIVLRGHVVDEIIRFAQEFGADLIVLGTHGRKGFRRAVLGSACEGVIRRATVPVLAVRHEAQ